MADMDQAGWYVVHTYSGYENKVKLDLEKTIKNRGLQDYIFDVAVPLQDVVEIRNGQRRSVQRKMFPGYVLVHMIKTDDTWYVVRNTRGVTGFVGPGSEPIPLTEEEIAKLGVMAGEGEVEAGFAVGDMITVIKGPWEGTMGAVREVNLSRQTLTINVDMFGGRETPVELSFEEVRLTR